jgi:hypothetical protein
MVLVESGGINPIYHLNRAPAQSGKNDFLLLASLTKGDVNLGLWEYTGIPGEKILCLI